MTSIPLIYRLLIAAAARFHFSWFWYLQIIKVPSEKFPYLYFNLRIVENKGLKSMLRFIANVKISVLVDHLKMLKST